MLVRSSDRCSIPLSIKMNKYSHQFSFAVMLCTSMQQLTAHVPSQIGLAKFESLLGLTPTMAN